MMPLILLSFLNAALWVFIAILAATAPKIPKHHD
jgi:hypothetical protein